MTDRILSLAPSEAAAEQRRNRDYPYAEVKPVKGMALPWAIVAPRKDAK